METTIAWPARWGLRLAILAFVLVAFGILGFRFGIFPFEAGIFGLIGGALIGLIAVLVSLIGIIFTMFGTRPGLAAAIGGLIIGAIVSAPIVNAAMMSGAVPPIHDITTDLDNPPAFIDIVAIREADGANPLDRANEEQLVAGQKLAYADLKTTEFGETPGKVFEAARDTVHDLGWKLVAQHPEQGLIEATDQTEVMGFKDDVAIRVSAAPSGGSLVDLRSVSRVGVGDLGTNAKRIKAFLDALDEKLGSTGSGS